MWLTLNILTKKTFLNTSSVKTKLNIFLCSYLSIEENTSQPSQTKSLFF